MVSATATAAAVGAGLPSGMLGSLDHLLRVAVVITVSLMAVYVARARTGREERLRRMAEIVRITQAAILREPPQHAAGVELAARYVSAYEEAGVGGDLYEVVADQDRLRIIVGDVCGKGLAAVRLASAVAGAFRQSAIVRPNLTQVARDLDDLVAREPTPPVARRSSLPSWSSCAAARSGPSTAVTPRRSCGTAPENWRS
ncbi:SpoIIE family protein phosphatase [Micromonospora sp. M12]